jgi:enoyl-CoA hydratase/carnithine racemase
MELNYNYTAAQVAQLHEQRFAHLLVREEQHILHLRLNRPEKKNALNPTLVRELAYAMNYAHFTPSVRLVILGAEGDTFCAGADLKAFMGGDTGEGSTIPQPNGEILLGELFKTVHKPVIARVEGNVFAGGFLFLAGATLTVARKGIRLGLPETKRGLFPFQVMASLMEVMPQRRVLDWCIRGYDLPSEKALEWGLLTHLVDEADMDSTVQTLSTEITANSPMAIQLGLEANDNLRRTAPESQHAYLQQMLMRAIQSPDAREGIAAFREKRKPNFNVQASNTPESPKGDF